MRHSHVHFNTPKTYNVVRFPLAAALLTYYNFPEFSVTYRYCLNIDDTRVRLGIPSYRK